MIKINNASYNVINSKVKYAQSTYNGYKGYAILVTLDIVKDEFKGYVSFYVDFFLKDDFKNIENKSYIENLNEFDSKVSMLEILTESDFTDFVNDVSYDLNLLDGRVNIIPQSKILDRMGFPSNWEEIAKIK